MVATDCLIWKSVDATFCYHYGYFGQTYLIQIFNSIQNSPELETDPPANDKIGDQSHVDQGDTSFRQIRQDVQDSSRDLLVDLR